jgi:hypothetical protein
VKAAPREVQQPGARPTIRAGRGNGGSRSSAHLSRYCRSCSGQVHLPDGHCWVCQVANSEANFVLKRSEKVFALRSERCFGRDTGPNGPNGASAVPQRPRPTPLRDFSDRFLTAFFRKFAQPRPYVPRGSIAHGAEHFLVGQRDGLARVRALAARIWPGMCRTWALPLLYPYVHARALRRRSTKANLPRGGGAKPRISLCGRREGAGRPRRW